jgi:hypothetical protein
MALHDVERLLIGKAVDGRRELVEIRRRVSHCSR